MTSSAQLPQTRSIKHGGSSACHPKWFAVLSDPAVWPT
jgi:hypothetical protein